MLENLRDNGAIIKAIEENTAEFLLAMGRAGGGEEYADDQIHWIIGDAPVAYHNAVVKADIAPSKVDALITETIVQFRLKNVSGSWHVSPLSQPSDLGKHLLAHGFKDGGTEIGMAIDLHSMTENLPLGENIRFEMVRTEADLKVWEDTLAQGFGEGEIEARWTGAMYRKLGYGEGSAWRHFLAYVNDTPVATTSLFLGSEVAGIYFVFTVPQARRRSIGAGITLAALQTARKLGYQMGVLGSSPMGYSVYRTLGFKEFCRLEVYEYRHE
jgi:GNAT superfamily N-acetyltransferase